VCSVSPCVEPTEPPTLDGESLYQFDHLEHATLFVPNAFMHVGGNVGEYLHFSGFAGVETGIANNGFDNDRTTLNDSTLTRYAIWVLGGGVEARFDPVYFSVHGILPLEEQRAVHFGPGVLLQAGWSHCGTCQRERDSGTLNLV
jgi:hypothetical protein